MTAADREPTDAELLAALAEAERLTAAMTAASKPTEEPAP